MKKVLILTVMLSSLAANLVASDNLYITSNKISYVIGEQVVFNVERFQESDLKETMEYPIFMDLVAPSGRIVQTKTMIKTEDGCYFFALADSLKTGVYRLIGNSKGASQAIKRIHVFALELEEQIEKDANRIECKVDGGLLVSNQLNRVVVRVTDNKGAGLATKGTLVNMQDSLVQYLDTDPNGMVAFDFKPSDSLYKVRFGQQTLDLKPKFHNVFSRVSYLKDSILIRVSKASNLQDTVSVSINGNLLSKVIIPSEKDSLDIKIAGSQMNIGIHALDLEFNSTQKRRHIIFNKPSFNSSSIGFEMSEVKNNQQVEMALEDSEDIIDYLSVSVIDNELTANLDFYEDFYFDQAGLDLLLVEERIFDSYLMFFGADIAKSENEERINAPQQLGVLAYRKSHPFDELSMLDLNMMKVLDIRCENIHGIHEFENAVAEKTQVFPYHFTTYLQPIDIADFKESADYNYPPLKSVITFGEKEVALVKSYDLQRNINLSYKSRKKEKANLPKPDYTYRLENFDVPNTMVDMINYIVKYVSVEKNSDGEPELSMYRYMSTYKYRGAPLLFLNDVPVYNTQTILNLNPKDFDRVEVRNSYQANGYLGNFSLNGSVSFYLKEGVDNPLEGEYTDLPVLEHCMNFNQKPTENEHAPDFRHQLYWNPKVSKTNDSFWIDLKSSDLNATYNVQVTAFLKDGTVVNNQSMLIVK